MNPRKIIYYPPSGEKYSPKDFIYLELTNEAEQQHIRHRLNHIAETEQYKWPRKWIKKIGNLYQLEAHDHRVYFILDGEKLVVVCFICRKVGQKAREEDLNRAEANLENYYQNKGDAEK